jgi:hypothetical protein
MSDSGDSSYDAFRENANSDHGAVQVRPAGSDQSSAENAGDGHGSRWSDPADHGGDHGPEGIDQPGGTGYEPFSGDPAEQAQGMTRGEYADYVRQGPAAGEGGSGSADAGDHRDLTGDGPPAEPLIRNDGVIPAPRETVTGESARSADPRASAGQAAGELLIHAGDGTGIPIRVVQLPPEGRTLGDDTATGIGLKPTGEQLLRMESEDSPQNRMDNYFRDLFERADDIRDVSGKTTEAIEAFRHRDGTGTVATSVHRGHAAHDRPSPDGPHVQDFAGSIAMMSVAVLAGARHWLKNREKEDPR